MKNIYTPFLLLLLSFFVNLLLAQPGHAQCPNGEPNGGTAYDTTIATPAGINSMQLKFPQFDPQAGMVTCVRLCVTITGVVDSVSIENNSASGQSADAWYLRTDQITGPGLATPLSNSVSKHYGPYALSASDGIIGSGPDFVYVKDTVLNATSVCRTISDSATISQFYGNDSVAYTYDISAFTNVSCTGGNYNSTVVTSAFVNFRFEYCTCPASVLPVRIYAFDISKRADHTVDLKWQGYDEIYSSYHYEAEVSRDGNNFSSIGLITKNSGTNETYKLSYTAADAGTGVYYFRIKQVFSNGYVHYSIIKQVRLGSFESKRILVYPNPSTGIVGIKFDNSLSGHFSALLYTTQGQMVVKKDIVVKTGSPYMELARIVPGVYWLRLTDKKSLESSVHQLLIK
jgi:hypothetical protein